MNKIRETALYSNYLLVIPLPNNILQILLLKSETLNTKY